MVLLDTKDVEEISSEITKGLEIIPVAHMREVLEHAICVEKDVCEGVEDCYEKDVCAGSEICAE